MYKKFSRYTSLLFIPIILSLLQSCSSNTQYTLDLFSLLSFGLALASIIFSIFTGWFSWELYKKSSNANDLVQSAVTRIEASVTGIRADISEIVKRAVSYWINENGVGEQLEHKVELDKKVEELKQQLESLSNGEPQAKSLQEGLRGILETQQKEIEKLNSLLVNAKVQNIFPNISSAPAISVSQDIYENKPKLNRGKLTIIINKPVKIATASGKFNFIETEENLQLDASLISSPYDNDNDIIITSGLGQSSDFHIHLRSPKALLKEGEYIVEYNVNIN